MSSPAAEATAAVYALASSSIRSDRTGPGSTAKPRSCSLRRRPSGRSSPQAVKRFRYRVVELTGRNRGIRLEQMIRELVEYLRGWIQYFGFCERRTDLRDLDGWIRRRLRCTVWRQWQNGRQRYRGLLRLGIKAERAKEIAGSSRGPWHMSRAVPMNQALSNRYLQGRGLLTLETRSNA
jgi:RNA-directed DNA polymerase